MLDVATKMWVNEGPSSLYRGLIPTLIQIGPYAGSQFAFYKFLINVFDRNELGKSLGVRSLLCGAMAGAVAKTLVYPLDLGKKRMQVHGFHRQHIYNG
jgi:solute carrier family 25 thiamine pyrophosphate transporter 19